MSVGTIRIALTPSDLAQYLKVLDNAGLPYEFVAWASHVVNLAHLQLRLRVNGVEPCTVGAQLCMDGTWTAWADLPVGEKTT